MSVPLAIVGCGKMGRLVEQLAPEYGFTVPAKFSRGNIATLSRESLHGASVAIEFTTPASAPSNLRRLAELADGAAACEGVQCRSRRGGGMSGLGRGFRPVLCEACI